MLVNRRNRASSVPNFFRNSDDVPSVVCDCTGVVYNVGTLLGKGGFAKCFLAYADRQEFALKVITRSSIKKASYMNKIRKEISTHFSLRHPNIVTLYSTFEDADNVYMLLEYCPNRTLAEYIESCSGRRIVESVAVVIFKQLLKAVRYLHEERGLLHRDIKPGNILLSRENTVKLADFGFCCSIGELEGCKSYTVCGTPNYVPAEVLDRMGHSIYSESWSIVCTFYCMLYGRPPFHSDCQEVTYAKIRKCCYIFPPCCKISDNAKEIIAKVLIQNRYSRLTVAEMLLHPLFSTLNLYVSHSNGLNSSDWTSSHCKMINSGNATPNYCYGPPVAVKKHGNRNFLLDSGLGSGGDLCDALNLLKDTTTNELLQASHSSTASSNIYEENHLRSAIYNYLKILPKCDNSFNPVYLLPIHVDLCNSFVAKWVDYTNKFGFGVTLKDGTRSLLFNDRSTVATSNSNHRMAFCPDNFDREEHVREWDFVDEIRDVSVAEKFQFLSFMRTYMDRELYSFVEIGLRDHSSSERKEKFRLLSSSSSPTAYPITANNTLKCDVHTKSIFCSKCKSCEPFRLNIDVGEQHYDRNCVLRRSSSSSSAAEVQIPITRLVDMWKCSAGLMMLLSDGTCQINFSESRYKIVACHCWVMEEHVHQTPVQKLRIFVVNPEHEVSGYEAVVSYDLDRCEPPDEIIQQLRIFGRTIQQYCSATFSSKNNISGKNSNIVHKHNMDYIYKNEGTSISTIEQFAKSRLLSNPRIKLAHFRSTGC